MNKTSCQTWHLAADGLCAVEYCPNCEVFHLKVGYTTLHLNPEAFMSLCGIIDTALARYHRQSRTTETGSLAETRETQSGLH